MFFYHQVQPLVVQVSMKASQSVPLYAALGVRKNVVQYPLITVYVPVHVCTHLQMVFEKP